MSQEKGTKKRLDKEARFACLKWFDYHTVSTLFIADLIIANHNIYLKVNLGALKYDGTDSFYFQIFAPFSRKVELSK